MDKNLRLTRRYILSFLLLFIQLISFENLSAQTPVGFDPNNLSSVRVDELSDDQVMQFIKQIQGSGFTIDQAEQIATRRGLPQSEARKLKDRIAKLQSTSKVGTSLNFVSAEDSIVNRNIEEGEKAALNAGKIIDEKSETPERPVTIYGQEYFRKGDIKIFDRSTDAKAPNNYVIGVGDELGVSVFGYSFFNEVLRVDERGAINPSQMGPVFVKGLTYEKAKSLIQAKMGQYFDLYNNQLEVTLAYSRSITVNIVGEVFQPGSYKIPAINTAFNALILAGGPTDIGTLRNIQIKRDGKVVRTLDIYTFLNDPGASQDFFLEDNDYIVVGSSQKIIKLSGEVKRPNTYELLANEQLNTVIKYAGGLTASAYKDKIQIVRRAAKESIILDVDLDSLQRINKDFALQNGDSIIIKSSINEIINKVSVAGAVNFPGDYNFQKGEKVTELLRKAGGLRLESDLESAYLVRTKPDQTKEYLRLNLRELLANPNSNQNILLQAQDQLTIYSQKDYIDNLSIEVLGAVRNEKKMSFVDGMTLGDALKNAGGFSLGAENLRIEIARLSYFSPDYQDGDDVRVLVESVQLSDHSALLNDQDANILLQPFDQIFVRSVPNFDFRENILLKGEVKYPGVYTLLAKDEKISDVLERAGGLTSYAFVDGATFYRPGLAGGFVVLKLKDVMKSKRTSRYNYTLKNGDVITIPTMTDYVSIHGGSVEYLSLLNQSQVNAPYVKWKRADYYIKNFGNGFTKDSWKKKTYVVQPNAKVNRTKNYLFFKVYPKVTKGSAIYVVNKVKKEKQLAKEREPFNWNKFIENTTVKLTGIATLFLLFRQL